VSFDLFKEVIPSLTTKQKILETEEDFRKDYVPYIINRFFSQYPSDIFFANEMNKRSYLPKDMQHDFYFNALRQGKRPFVPWVKRQPKQSDIQNVAKLYGMSYRRAAESMKLFTDKQLKEIDKLLDTGGK